MKILNDGEQPLGRYSFLMADPFQTIEIPRGSEQPFAEIRQLLDQFSSPTLPDLPPMQGGLAGYFSYDLNQSIERIDTVVHDEFQLPAIVLAAYDVVIAWDHQLNRTWMISHGFPENSPVNQKQRAQKRIEFFSNLLINIARRGEVTAENGRQDFLFVIRTVTLRLLKLYHVAPLLLKLFTPHAGNRRKTFKASTTLLLMDRFTILFSRNRQEDIVNCLQQRCLQLEQIDD